MKFVFFVALVACHLSLPAQAIASPESLLATAFDDPRVLSKIQYIDFKQHHNVGLSFINDVSLRTETDRFQWARQEYLTRISVNGLQAMHRYRRLQQTEYAVTAAEKEKQLHDALYERYTALAVYYAVQKELALRQKLLLVYKDQLKVLEKTAAYAGETDPEGMIEAAFDRDELALRIRENQDQLAQIEKYCAALLPSGEPISGIDTSFWISSDKILQVLNRDAGFTPTHPALLEKEAKIEQIRAEYALEKAKAQRILDFFQLRYADRSEEDPFRYKMDVGIGFRLPYDGTRAVRKSAIAAEQRAEEQELALYREDLRRMAAEACEETIALNARRQLIKEQIAASQAQFAPQKTAPPDKNSLQALLRLEELQLKRALKLQDTEAEIAQRYLSVLYLGGQLSQQPLKNYLRENLPPIGK